MARKRKKKGVKNTSLENKENIAPSLLSEDELIREAQSNFAPIPHNDSFTEKDFSDSVASLTPELIPEAEKEIEEKGEKKKRNKGQNAFELTLLGICAVAAVVCLVLLFFNIRGKIRGNEIYDNTEFDRFTLDTEKTVSFNHPSALLNLKGDSAMLTLYDRITAGKTPESSDNGEYSEKLAAMKASLTALKAKNDDICGWIYVENTKIDYPILKGDDNDYYLDHAYTGESLPIGSIFVDYHCKDTFTDNYNTVIYGHNVVTGAMFHDVTKFLNADFFAENKIYVYTMDGVLIYKPVSVYPTTEKYFYYRIKFSSSSDFLDFAAEVISKSSVPCNEKITKDDTMITLSTCTNGSDGGRYALHAKLIETIK